MNKNCFFYTFFLLIVFTSCIKSKKKKVITPTKLIVAKNIDSIKVDSIDFKLDSTNFNIDSAKKNIDSLKFDFDTIKPTYLFYQKNDLIKNLIDSRKIDISTSLFMGDSYVSTTNLRSNNDSTNNYISNSILYDTSKTYIYLTFDDGPQNGTKACIDVCKKLETKATFFMVGEHASSPFLKEIVQFIKGNYPNLLLANHSTTHANGKYHFFYEHENFAAEDFYLAQKTLHVPFKIIRLPGNTSWVLQNKLRANGLTKPVCKLLDSAGYNVIGWDIEWNFTRPHSNPVESVERMVKKIEYAIENNNLNTKKHLVILTHDRMFQKSNYTDSLFKFISILKENSKYIFETLDHYPGLKPL